MAKDNAFRLVSKIIEIGDVTPVLERGISSTWFHSSDTRQLFTFIVDYFTKYGDVPSRVTFRDNFPAVKLVHVQDSIDYLIDQMVSWWRQQNAAELLTKASESFHSGDHEEALQVLSSGLLRLEAETSIGSTDIDLVEGSSAYLREYQERARNGGNRLLGLSTGFRTIDEATAGIQPGQLITIVATPKAGKSTLAMKIAINMHEKDTVVPLFQSFEMSNREQADRHAAIRARVAHARLVRGALTGAEEQRLDTMLKQLGRLEHPFVLSDAAEGLTLSAVRAKLSKHSPQVLIVDGVYLMYDEISGERGTPQALTNLTRGFKSLAQRCKIPVIITTQALTWKMRGGKLTADSIGYSSSFFQDSDVILGLEFIDEESPDERRLKIVASRNCGPAETQLMWDFENGTFEEFAA